MGEDHTFRSRRFVLAMGFYLGMTIGMFIGKIKSEDYIWGSGIVLAGYGFTRSKFMMENISETNKNIKGSRPK